MENTVPSRAAKRVILAFFEFSTFYNRKIAFLFTFLFLCVSSGQFLIIIFSMFSSHLQLLLLDFLFHIPSFGVNMATFRKSTINFFLICQKPIFFNSS